MRSYTHPAQVNAGEKMWIELSNERTKATCIWNDRNNQRMEVCYYVLWVLPLNFILSYTASEFKSFAAMNENNEKRINPELLTNKT